MAEVVAIRWPEERDDAARLAAAGVAVLYLVDADDDPPVPTGCLEDWVRIPGEERDLRARLAALELRAELHHAPPFVDDDDRLHHGGRVVALSPIEARLAAALTARIGAAVSDERLLEAVQQWRRDVGRLLASGDGPSAVTASGTPSRDSAHSPRIRAGEGRLAKDRPRASRHEVSQCPSEPVSRLWTTRRGGGWISQVCGKSLARTPRSPRITWCARHRTRSRTRRRRAPCLHRSRRTKVSIGGPITHVGESCLLEHLLPARTGQPAGDSAGPQVDVAQRLGRNGSAVGDVGELQHAAGSQHAADLGEDGAFVGAEVDDAVGDHDVGPVVVDGKRFGVALSELHVREAQLLWPCRAIW